MADIKHIALPNGNTYDISGGGHVIKDNNGVALAQMDNLKFIGLKVENDTTNGDTDVIVFERVSQATFDSYTDAQKEAGNFYVYDAESEPDAINVGYDGTSVSSSATTVQAALDEDKTAIRALNSEITDINSDLVKYYQCQFELPSSVTVSANSSGELLSNVNPRSLTNTALDHVPSTGTLHSCVFLWTNQTCCSPTQTLVLNGNIKVISVWNNSNAAVTLTQVRLLLGYKDV